MFTESKFQIGKNNITEGVINSIDQDLKNHNQIRISILKAATRDKAMLKQMAEEIIKNVNYKCKYRIIGFTIILKRQSGEKYNK